METLYIATLLLELELRMGYNVSATELALR
jgi:hypothetical protein